MFTVAANHIFFSLSFCYIFLIPWFSQRLTTYYRKQKEDPKGLFGCVCVCYKETNQTKQIKINSSKETSRPWPPVASSALQPGSRHQAPDPELSPVRLRDRGRRCATDAKPAGGLGGLGRTGRGRAGVSDRTLSPGLAGGDDTA